MNIEINKEFQEALDRMEYGKSHIFITGKAGTGKSTLLKYFRKHTEHQVVVLAPTGVAAVNVSGQTIHSFFKFRPNITAMEARKKGEIAYRSKWGKIYKRLEIIIIDEISMVRADLLDTVDEFLKKARKNDKPFGGVRMIFIGDLFQLPPVVTRDEAHIFQEFYKSPYFFDSVIYEALDLEFFELKKIYRQKDNSLVSILNKIRNNEVDTSDLEKINRRFNPYLAEVNLEDDFYVFLTTLNSRAHQINSYRLSLIKGETKRFDGIVEGEFSKGSLPTEEDLKLKKGAQIMLLNNDSAKRWVNGTVAKILDMEEDEILVKLPNGEEEIVTPVTWELYKHELNKDTKLIRVNSVGAFTQFPIKLAWAVTIHKAQGKTFERVIIDFARGAFATGQAYVAFSRCTNLEGIILTSEFRKEDILVDARVNQFISGLSQEESH